MDDVKSQEDRNSVDEQENVVSKHSFRQQVWDTLFKTNASAFPKPFGRIPNFKGADSAAARLLQLEEFQQAKSVEINPDKPLEYARVITLEKDKDLYVPVPRLTNCLLKKLTKDNDMSIKKIVSRWGIDNTGHEVNLDDSIHIDLFILGSVAVSKSGYRVGKGKGYADLEYAILKDMEAVNDDTVIITIVHDTQVFDDLPCELFQKYDVPVDIILTPTQIIKVEQRLPRPEKLFWEILSKRRVLSMKILQQLKQKHESLGLDTTLKEIDSDTESRVRTKKTKKPLRKFNYNRNGEIANEDNGNKPKRKFYRKWGQKQSPENVDDQKDSEGSNKSPKKFRNQKKSHQKLHIDFSLLVSNIERNVRVRDIKNALTEHGIKPNDITWKGYKGFCYLHYSKPFNKKNDKENEEAKPFSVDNVIEVLQSLKFSPDSSCNLKVNVMEPITRIETTDVTSV